MPDLAAVPGRTGQRLTVDDEAATDADRAPDEQHVVDADAPPRDEPPRVRRDRTRWRRRSGRRSQRRRPGARRAARRASRGSGPSTPSRRSDGPRPTTATPAPTIGWRRRQSSRASSSASSARSPRCPRPSVARGEGRPAASSSDHVRPARRRPRRANRRRSRARARPRGRDWGGRAGEGRPGVPSARPALGRRGLPATSSPMRPRIALRVSPVRVTRSERDIGPLSWSSRTMALRFARRTVSLRCPRSSRPRSRGLCSSLSNAKVPDSGHARDRVKPFADGECYHPRRQREAVAYDEEDDRSRR